MVTANEVASVILSRSGPWTDAMTLQKLLYYVQAWHLAITDEPLFSEHFKAYRDGPVLPQVRHARMDRASRRASTQDLTGVILDELSSDIIDVIVATYGQMSGPELSALTHDERPWQEARRDLPEDASGNEAISETSMAKFYRAHRTLGGRTAADLAAGGLHVRAAADAGHSPIDIDALLAEIPEFEAKDSWGGANLDVPKPAPSAGTLRRKYAGS